MSEYLSLYKDFWKLFFATENLDSRFGTAHKSKNGNPGYAEFPGRFDCGFRLVGTLSGRNDRLGAEFFSASRMGREFVAGNLDPAGSTTTLNGSSTFWNVNETDAKIEILWQNAGLRNRALWNVHQAWLKSVLTDLETTYSKQVRGWGHNGK